MRRIAATAILIAFLVLAACGSDATPAKTTASAETGAARGALTVFAAASLTEAFTDVQTSLRSSTPSLTITYSFAGSGALAAQVQQGAPADVIATADTATMKKLVDAGLVDAPTTFARNQLSILVAPGNPKGVHGLSDLSRADLVFVTEDPTVPAGTYAAQILEAAHVTVHPASEEPDVKSAVAKVTTGEADAAIVYVTDVAAAGSKAEGIAIPDEQNVVAEYPIAIVKATRNRAAAAAFVDAVVGASGQDALQHHGFLRAS